MISVLLTLLKILGIVLLALLGLVLLLIILVLFIPAKYRVKGYYREEFVCNLKASWLLHFVSVSVQYNKEIATSVRILGIPLSVFYRRKNEKPDNTQDSSVINYEEPNNSVDTNSANQKIEPEENTVSDIPLLSKKTIKNIKPPNESIHPGKNKNVYQKIIDFINGIKKTIYNYINTIKMFFINLKTKKESLEYYISLLKSAEVKAAFALCKKRLLKVLKHILPRRTNVILHLGFEDPATTGYILGGYSLLPAYLSKKIILYPDFNNNVFTCDFDLKGHMNAWNFLYHVLCIISDKNCKSLYQIVKKEISNERK